jgi:hypothetical protein
MDQSELQELLMKVLTAYGPDLANMTNEASVDGNQAMNLGALMSKLGAGNADSN